MPVVSIKGPPGLSKNAKKDLIEGTLHALISTYQMPDDRDSRYDERRVNTLPEGRRPWEVT
jgi:hypothetical protein